MEAENNNLFYITEYKRSKMFGIAFKEVPIFETKKQAQKFLKELSAIKYK